MYHRYSHLVNRECEHALLVACAVASTKSVLTVRMTDLRTETSDIDLGLPILDTSSLALSKDNLTGAARDKWVLSTRRSRTKDFESLLTTILLHSN